MQHRRKPRAAELSRAQARAAINPHPPERPIASIGWPVRASRPCAGLQLGGRRSGCPHIGPQHGRRPGNSTRTAVLAPLNTQCADRGRCSPLASPRHRWSAARAPAVRQGGRAGPAAEPRPGDVARGPCLPAVWTIQTAVVRPPRRVPAEEVHLAQEIGDEGVGRAVVQLPRWAQLHQPAAIHAPRPGPTWSAPPPDHASRRSPWRPGGCCSCSQLRSACAGAASCPTRRAARPSGSPAARTRWRGPGPRVAAARPTAPPACAPPVRRA